MKLKRNMWKSPTFWRIKSHNSGTKKSNYFQKLYRPSYLITHLRVWKWIGQCVPKLERNFFFRRTDICILQCIRLNWNHWTREEGTALMSCAILLNNFVVKCSLLLHCIQFLFYIFISHLYRKCKQLSFYVSSWVA